VSSNTALTQLHCSSNQLTYLNMKNGLTDQLSSFSAQNNSLTCIETENWTYETEDIDEGVTFDVICGAAARTHWHVATTGSDAAGSGTLASPLANIQTAINAATDGDTVSVAAGTYVENINFNGKNIAVIGADSSNTIIDGDSSGAVVVFNGGGGDSTAVLKNFKITNGSGRDGIVGGASAGGGIVASSKGTLENLFITGNSAVRAGGMWIGADVTLKNSTISNNFSSGGGGVMIQASSPTLTNVLITNNTSSERGGGLWTYAGPNNFPVLTNVTITGNVAGTNGGGCYLDGPSPIFQSCDISNNTAGGSGGGIYSENSSFTLDGVTVSNNISTDGASIDVTSNDGSDKHVRIYNSTISDNTISGGSAAGIHIFAIDSVTIVSTEILGNSGGSTGGLATNQVIYFNMSNSLVAENTGEYYGGVSFLASAQNYFTDLPVQITNCTIADNSYTDTNWSEGQSAGLIVERWAFVSVMNSIITSEQSPAVTVGNHSYADSPAELTIDYSMVEGGQAGITTYGTLNWGDGNIDADPLFTDAVNGDYTLQSGSPAIDVGNPNAFYNDGDGTRNDMGNTGGNGISLSATEIDFGYLGVGDSRDKTLTITNTNDSDISVSGAAFDDAQFSASTSLPITISSYSSADIQQFYSTSPTSAIAIEFTIGSKNLSFTNKGPTISRSVIRKRNRFHGNR